MKRYTHENRSGLPDKYFLIGTNWIPNAKERMKSLFIKRKKKTKNFKKIINTENTQMIRREKG